MTIETLALISTIVIFIITVVINAINISVDRRKRWYVEVVVSQNQDLIKEFYSEILKKFKSSKTELLAQYSTISHLDLIRMSAKKKEELHAIKNKFNFQIIPIIKSFDEETSVNLLNNLLEFQDIYTKGLDINEDGDLETLVRSLENSKREFYQILYQPIERNYFLNYLFSRNALRIVIIIFAFLGLILLMLLMIYWNCLKYIF